MRALSIVCVTIFAFHLLRAQVNGEIVEENGKWYILGTDGPGGTTTTEMTNAVSQGTPDNNFKNENEQDISDEKLVQVSDSGPDNAQEQAQQFEVPQEKTGGRLNWWNKSSKPQTIEDEIAMRKNTQEAFQKVFNAQTQSPSAPLPKISISPPYEQKINPAEQGLPQEKTGGRLNWWGKQPASKPIEDELAVRRNTNEAFQKIFNAQAQSAPASASLQKIANEPKRNPAEENNSDGKIVQLSDSDPNEPQQQAQQFEQVPKEKTKDRRFNWWGQKSGPKPIEDELTVRRNTQEAYQKVFNAQTQSASAPAPLPKIAISPPYQPKINPAEQQAARELAPLRQGKDNTDEKLSQLSDAGLDEAQQLDESPPQEKTDRRLNWWGKKSPPRPIEDEITVRRNTHEAFQKMFNARAESSPEPASLPQIAISPPYEPKRKPAEEMNDNQESSVPAPKPLPNIAISPVYEPQRKNMELVSTDHDVPPLKQAAQVPQEKSGGRSNWWGKQPASKPIEDELAVRRNTNEAFQKIFTAQAQSAPAAASLPTIAYERPYQPKGNPAEQQAPQEKTGGRLNWWGKQPAPKPIEAELTERQNTNEVFQKILSTQTQSASGPPPLPKIAISPPYEPKRKPVEEMNNNQESSAPAPKPLPNIAISPVYEPQRKNIELVSTDDDAPPPKQALDTSDGKLVQISDSDPDEAQQPAQQFQVPEENTGGRLNWWSKSSAPKPIEAELSERQNTHEAFQKIFNALAQSAPAPAPLPKIAISPPYEPKSKPVEERRTGGPDLGLQQSSIDEEMALLQSTQGYFKKVNNNQESSVPAPKPLPQIGISPVYEPPRKNIELPLTNYSSDERFLSTQSQTSRPFVKGRPIRLESLPNDEEVQYSVQMNNYQASSAPQPLPKIGISPVYKPKSQPLESRPTGGSDLGLRQDLYNPPPAPTYQTVLDRRAKTSKAQKKPTMTRYAVNKVYRSPDEMFLMTQSEAKRKKGPVVSGLGPAPQFETSRPIVDEGPLRYRLESLPDDEKVQDERQILQQTRLRQSQWPPGPQIQPTMQTRVEQSQYEPVQQYSRWQPQIQPVQQYGEEQPQYPPVRQYREEQPQYPPVQQYREEQPQYPPVRQSRLQQPHYAHYV